MQQLKAIPVSEIQMQHTYVVHEVQYERYETPAPTITMMNGEELFDYLIDIYGSDYDLSTPIGRAAFLEYVEDEMACDGDDELTIYTSEYN